MKDDHKDVLVKPKRGRPRKADVEAKKKGNRNSVGRPKGDAARINELKARLLATSGDKVINKVIQIALEDGHPVQSAALKMCMDRVLPVSYFDKKNYYLDLEAKNLQNISSAEL